MRKTLALAVAVAALTPVSVGLVALVGVACGPSGFDPASLIESVRILASQSDQPYAQPGATVRSQLLAVDGRPDAGSLEPMRLFWLPFVCVNPPNDAYYACFTQFRPNASSIAQVGGKNASGGGTAATITGAISSWDGGADAGVGATLLGDAGLGGGGARDGGAGGLTSLPTGVDISPYLVQGSRAVFQIPADIVTSHVPPKGATAYGVAIVFNIACAGHVELLPIDPNSVAPEQIPFGCFNAQHQKLTANDYVLGYTEVFAYDSLTNHNPTIQSFSFRGTAASPDGGLDAGFTFPSCDPSVNKSCPDNLVITNVPDASWEPDPQNPGGPDGGPLGEQIWVDYYSTVGKLSDEAELIYDPARGHVTPHKDENLQTVPKPQTGTMWAVVHDNRGGAAWVTVPLTAQ
jgi:hypothetical protein